MNNPARMANGKYRRIYLHIIAPPILDHGKNVRFDVFRNGYLVHHFLYDGYGVPQNGFPNLNGSSQEEKVMSSVLLRKGKKTFPGDVFGAAPQLPVLIPYLHLLVEYLSFCDLPHWACG